MFLKLFDGLNWKFFPLKIKNKIKPIKGGIKARMRNNKAGIDDIFVNPLTFCLKDKVVLNTPFFTIVRSFLSNSKISLISATLKVADLVTTNLFPSVDMSPFQLPISEMPYTKLNGGKSNIPDLSISMTANSKF
jgi:hypothetical protein